MRIVVISSGGLVHQRIAAIHRDASHEVVEASPGSKLDTLAEKALVEALVGAEVLVDLTDPLSFAIRAVPDVFAAVALRLSKATAFAGVGHHIALSTIGVGRIGNARYFRAKAVQENLIRASFTPYTIVQATQSLELIDSILQFGFGHRAIIGLPIALVQPITADALAAALAAVATTPPKNATIELAGPEPIYLHELARLILSGYEDRRRVIASERARYFGALLSNQSLMPGPAPQIGSTTPRDWLRHFITAG